MLFRGSNISNVHPDLVKIVSALAVESNILVICGFRNQADQEKAFNEGFSRVQFPKSKHNQIPSLAVDIAPCSYDGKSINWNDIPAFMCMANKFKTIADEFGIEYVWGGNFKSFKDYPHFQLELK